MMLPGQFGDVIRAAVRVVAHLLIIAGIATAFVAADLAGLLPTP